MRSTFRKPYPSVGSEDGVDVIYYILEKILLNVCTNNCWHLKTPNRLPMLPLEA